MSIAKLSVRHLETLYAELRRCRVRCDRKPFVEHTAAGEHDCAKAKCKPHVCKPMAASTVRQIHSIISGALSAAVRWDWLESNPARMAQRPKQKPPEPAPPSPAEAARLVDEAFRMDDDWGALVWLVMTTGLRRGEVCILRWSRVDLDVGEIEIRSSYRLRKGVGTEKDTKTHQMRRIALDTETVVLLQELKQRWRARLAELGLELTDDMYVFTGYRQTVPTVPYSPHGVSSRYKDMADRLGIDTHIHALRHYSATELQMGGIASDASLDKIRERPLPATSPFRLIMISVDERAVMTSDQAIGLAVAIDDAMLHQILLHHMPNRCIGCN